jgi:hypothetical protein
LRVLAHPDDFLPMYNRLKFNQQKNKAMLEAINNVKQQLQNSNHPLGANHKKETIPKSYIKKYNLQALYHFDMPADYRLLYTVRKASGGGKEALFLELLTHDEYNKLFGYFKKKSH